MKKNILLFCFACCFLAFSLQAQKTISGTVISGDGEPLIGANILELGTANGTVTDLDGNFSLTLLGESNQIEISYTGFGAQTVDVSSGNIFNVTLDEGTDLDEVVVTALGIAREKKALSYASQNVSTDELSQARGQNPINALSGKVAGLSIVRSGSGVGADSRVVLRGNKSFNGNSQPLYVVDGVPIVGDITDINPDDIVDIQVLQGANASALYGNRGQNGVILVTTNSGGQGFNISLSTTLTSEAPLFFREYQQEYAQGNVGMYNAASEDAWGPRMGGNEAHWSNNPNFPDATYNIASNSGNVEDFFQTGFSSATNISMGGGNERTTTYFSYTYTDGQGVVPGNELDRHNAHIRVNNKLTNRLTLDAKLNYIRENIDNQLAQGENFSNPIRHAFRLPPNIRTADIEQFEFEDASGAIRQHYWNPGSNGGANPYFVNERVKRLNLTDRIIGLISLKYDFTDKLSLQVRSAIDNINRRGEERLYNDNYIFADNGRFSIGSARQLEWNNDFLVTYNERALTEDISLSISAGGNSRKERASSLSANTGDALIIPNLFTLGNTAVVQANNSIGSTVEGSPRDVNSLYALLNFGYKDAIFVDVTARNDWSSTLPEANRSFFYSSFGTSILLSELMDFPDFFDYVKVRASYAEVGNDTKAYQLVRIAQLNSGILSLSPTIPNSNLQPELTTSIEFGADFRVWNNRAGLQFTYYKSNTTDQLFSIQLPIGSGASEIFTNGGDVQNSGVEAIFSITPIKKELTWDLSFNFTANRSEVISINDERPSISLVSDFMRETRVEQGEPWGNVYSRGYERDVQGRILVGDDGLPLITAGRTVLVGNYNPDWLGGISNSLTYKNFSLSFLIDIRQGGQTASITDAITFGNGLTTQTLPGREGMVLGRDFLQGETFVKEDGTPNDISTTAEAFWKKVGGRNAPVGEVFAVDASNVRMREIVFGYVLPIESDIIKRARVSLVGRNLFFFSNAAETFDPEVVVGTGNGVEGFESFSPPTTRSFGASIKFDF